jgi:hypothetical protein
VNILGTEERFNDAIEDGERSLEIDPLVSKVWDFEPASK